MRYLALLYGQESEVEADPTSQAFADEMSRYQRFEEFAGEAIVGGEALEPTSRAISLRFVGDDPVVTDGVLSEAAEVIGGLFVLEAEDLDGAIEIARHLPAAEDGAVELRPLVDWYQNEAHRPDGSTRYLALLRGTEPETMRPGTAAWEAAVEEHARFEKEEADAILGGGALHPSDTGTVLRVRGGQPLLTEGSFAEVGEVIGGLYLLAAGDQQEIVRLAKGIPMGPPGIIELRPIVEMDG